MTPQSSSSNEVQQQSHKRFKRLAVEIEAEVSTASSRSRSSGSTDDDELAAYFSAYMCYTEPTGLNILSEPASEANVERVLAVCGVFAAGKRNGLSKNLERRTFLTRSTADAVKRRSPINLLRAAVVGISESTQI